MFKKYKKIEYTGDMTNKDIAKEVFNQIFNKDCAVDLFEKMECIQISCEKVSYGHFDIGFVVEYEGAQKNIETDEVQDRKGKNQFERYIYAVILSDKIRIEGKEVLNIFSKEKIDNFEKNEEFDSIAKRIVKVACDCEDFKERVKMDAEIWLNPTPIYFEGVLKVDDEFEVLDGIIIETKGLQVSFRYDGKEYKNICILKGDDCIIVLDYPKETGQGKSLVENEKDPEFVSSLSEYNEVMKNYEDMKLYKDVVDQEVWERTEKSVEKAKQEYDKVIKQYFTLYKKAGFERIIVSINNMIIDNDYDAKNDLMYNEYNDAVEVGDNSTANAKNVNKTKMNDEYFILKELNNLIGLERVKKDVKSMVDLITVNNKRKEMNLPVTPMSYHLVFSGNPGTGKTTVARILAKIYKSLGIIKENKVIEVDRSELVAGYVGQTAIKTQEVIDSAKGGILFIDEAYTLTRSDRSDDFGQEAIDTLLKEMEDNRENLVVIVAGYTDLMRKFISSNPGLESRFNKYIEFEDYTPDELYEILELDCKSKGYTLDDDAKECAKEFFTNRYNNRDTNYANARDVRNFFEKAIVNQSTRIVKIGVDNISKAELMKILKDDIKDIVLK